MFVRTVPRYSSPFIRRAALVLTAITLVGTGQLSAQEAVAQPKTHTVKRGDTLWDIAKTYLGDPFLWPEIYRLNTDVVEDPHWIYPGEVLKLPGESTKVVAEAPATLPAMPAPVAQAEIPKATVFQPPVSAEVTSTVVSQQGDQIPTVRFGEHLAAPWVDQRGGPVGSGKILRPHDLSIHVQSEEHSNFQLYDPLLFAPPAGGLAAPRMRYLTYVLGPLIEEFGQIVIPTGVIEVTRAPQNGEAGIARVIKMFGAVEVNQRIMPFDSAAAAVFGTPAAVSNGRAGTVRWMHSQPLLPSIQQFLVLDIGRREGLTLGDRVQLFQPRQGPRDDGDLATPEVSVGYAQIVRVTPFGATAVLNAVQQPKIQVGTAARVSAKMP